jgi:hypothetical protein
MQVQDLIWKVDACPGQRASQGLKMLRNVVMTEEVNLNYDGDHVLHNGILENIMHFTVG